MTKKKKKTEPLQMIKDLFLIVEADMQGFIKDNQPKGCVDFDDYQFYTELDTQQLRPSYIIEWGRRIRNLSKIKEFEIDKKAKKNT